VLYPERGSRILGPTTLGVLLPYRRGRTAQTGGFRATISSSALGCHALSWRSASLMRAVLR